MSIGDHPNYLANGYLLNQNMIRTEDKIKKIEYQKDLETIIIRTNRRTDYEKKLRKKITTSGCAQGTVFGDIYEEIEKIKLAYKNKIKHNWIYELSKHKYGIQLGTAAAGTFNLNCSYLGIPCIGYYILF